MASLTPGPTLTAWRTTKRTYAPVALDGKGAATYGGRWNPVGVPAVYLSSSRALSILEVLTQVRGPADLRDYVLIPVALPESAVMAVEALPADWRALPAGESTRRIGAEWAMQKRTLVLRVPSVVLPMEANYVLNPLHPDAADLAIGDVEELDLDPRLFPA